MSDHRKKEKVRENGKREGGGGQCELGDEDKNPCEH